MVATNDWPLGMVPGEDDESNQEERHGCDGQPRLDIVHGGVDGGARVVVVEEPQQTTWHGARGAKEEKKGKPPVRGKGEGPREGASSSVRLTTLTLAGTAIPPQRTQQGQQREQRVRPVQIVNGHMLHLGVVGRVVIPPHG